MSAPAAAARDAGVYEPLPHLDRAREGSPAEQRRRVLQGARRLREELLAGPQVAYYRSFPLVRVPYPSRYAFWRAGRVATPLLHILNRLFVVQFRGLDGELKTLLFSPSDVDRNKETPFFKDLAAKAALLGGAGERLIAPRYGDVAAHLAAVGIAPERVDYLSYDHLHTQDLRGWIGPGGLFPRARLLVHEREWEEVHGLIPPWSAWYPPGGVAGIDPSRVIPFAGSVRLGVGVALVETPGHTRGNHSLVAHTPEGLLVTSENGVSADNYAPLRSKIPGVAAYAASSGSEVVLNGNTLEGHLDQYLSMLCERELAGPSLRDPAFFNVLPSSELSAYWLFPGVRPTFRFGEVEFGTPRP
ncbi:MAG: hypothetical protein AB7N76_15340 [Planctomycetota bacterium]